MGQVSGGPEGHDLTRAKPVCSRHILVRPAFKMRVYLGRIVELDREPTYEVGPKLAIYRSTSKNFYLTLASYKKPQAQYTIITFGDLC